MFLVGLSVIKVFKADLYNQLINLRYSLNKDRLESADAVTIINDLLSNKNALLYVINYIINYVRMLFPIELISKGGKYVIFFIYQIMFSTYLITSIKTYIIDKNNIKKCYLCMLIGYLSVANLFEPDFGSLIRHETALFYIFVSLFFYNKINKGNKNEQNKICTNKNM